MTGVLQHTFYKLHASAAESNELNITLEQQQQQQQQHPAAQQHQQHPAYQYGDQQYQQPQSSQFDIVLTDAPGSTVPAYPTTIQVGYHVLGVLNTSSANSCPEQRQRKRALLFSPVAL